MANQEAKSEKEIAAEYPLVISFLREDLQDVRSELREIRNKIDELRKDMNKMLVWIIGTMVAMSGIIIAVVKL
jgi:uncharacterized coiled-coil DUF342 family protein